MTSPGSQQIPPTYFSYWLHRFTIYFEPEEQQQKQQQKRYPHTEIKQFIHCYRFNSIKVHYKFSFHS